MKKITITLCVLFSLNAFSQTVLFNYEAVNADYEFCFDTPNPDQCTSTRETNNDQTGDNTTATHYQSIAPTTGGPFGYGIGIHFEAAAPGVTLNNNGKFLTLAFRSNNNPTGDLPITAQLWQNDSDKIDAFSSYTKTDGSWEIIEFDYTASSPQGVFTDNTTILRVLFFVQSGEATGYTYGIDNAAINQASLSLNEFNQEKASVYPNPADNILNISGEFIGEKIQILNVLGKVISEEIINNTNHKEINTSNLSNGIYFLRFENGNTLRFAKK